MTILTRQLPHKQHLSDQFRKNDDNSQAPVRISYGKSVPAFPGGGAYPGRKRADSRFLQFDYSTQ
ncbi:hypothetical protein FYJ44_08215 [Desulfovibrio sp. PG-178-WT-4]|uniref:Uncharacterized protein n=1 Tax=Desulfovibrio porci TaxID=2605782 RepID=A0A6L5XLD7_9BACT|nr:hypothetical protein [Desulfovibrio porci]MSS28024.1 hypothetical protein [Desulfovibrio porci]